MPSPLALLARAQWQVDQQSLPQTDQQAFNSLEYLQTLPMQQVTLDRRSGVARLKLEAIYYVKTFQGRGNRLKHCLGISRYQREIRNLRYFATLGLGTPTLLAFGQRYRLGLLQHAVLVTREVDNAIDLERALGEDRLYQHGVCGARKILRSLALAVRQLHADGFYHKDLKTRNILLRESSGEPQLYFFDCPSGHHPLRFLLRRGIVRDLAHLEEGLRAHLRRADLLYLYKIYRGSDKLSEDDKALARDALAYHSRRRMTARRRRREERKRAAGAHPDASGR